MPRTPKPKISPRKQPTQARSQRTVNIILQAATRVLTKESLAGFNTNRIAEVAGISVGSLYQYFPNKDALVTALIKAEHEILIQRLRELGSKMATADARETLRALAKLAVAQQFVNPVFAAAIDHEEARLPLKKELEQVHNTLLHCVFEMTKPHFPNITLTEVQDCITIGQALVESEAGSAKAPPIDLEVRVYRALSGYLGLRD